ncbi:MAG: ATP-binding cassette domain-containing protein [Salinisphaera sp.]|jgi:phospholipid/cholesterol/gamma-HCH transport system ATP-binding protein|nr:ATP-binding cassette domain-containing protein [Salinisphaera sp.]
MENATDAVVEVRDLGVRFGSQWVLEHIDLDLKRGEILSLVGASGSGKTTLMRQIIGLSRPSQGSVHVLGHSVHDDDHEVARMLRARWGVLFQHSALFSALTVFENIAFPLRELEKRRGGLSETDIHALVILKLEMVGLKGDIAWLMPAELSGGMAKRVALARALVLDADILLLDEPTSGLDPDSASEFDQLLGELHATLNLSALVVTHDINTLAALSDRVAVVDSGRLLTVGSLQDVVDIDNPFIERFFHGSRGAAALQQRGL